MSAISYLFNYSTSSDLVFDLAEIVDDFLLRRREDVVVSILRKVDDTFTLGKLAHGPGLLRLFKLSMCLIGDLLLRIYGDDKLDVFQTRPLTRVCRRNFELR